MDVLRRIAHRIIITESGCWEWQGSKNKGYGQLNVNRRPIGTHRLTYEAIVGPIPPGHEIDHLCRNPACCFPGHLEAVTHAENVARGRAAAAQIEKFAARTHCKWGHEMTPENTYRYTGGAKSGNGNRACRECLRRNLRVSRARRKERGKH